MQLRTDTSSFQNDRHGAGGIAAELRKCADQPGRVARFAIMQHPVRNPAGDVRKVVAVGPDLELTTDDKLVSSWRFAGEGGKIDGNGSHALIPTWSPDQSVELAAATLAFWIARDMQQGEEVFVL